MKVHRELGSGFLEAVYEEAFSREFALSEIPLKNQVKLNAFYDGQQLNNITNLILFVMIKSY